MRLFY